MLAAAEKQTMTDEINLRGAIVLRPARAFSALRVLGAVFLCLATASVLPITGSIAALLAPVESMSPQISIVGLLLIVLASVGSMLNEINAANHTIVD
jgi:hypothetical protein